MNDINDTRRHYLLSHVTLVTTALVVMLLVIARIVWAADLTPEQKLKAEVQRLQEQVLSLQASLAQCELTAQATDVKIKHQILEAEFRASLKCGADDDLDGWPPTGCKKKPSAIGGSKPQQ